MLNWESRGSGEVALASESLNRSRRYRRAFRRAAEHNTRAACALRKISVTSALPKELVELLAAGPIIVSCHAFTNSATNTSQPINSHHEYSC
jgi:hypothetical protein